MRCYWSDLSDHGDAEWEEAERFHKAGIVGLLLDLDEGTLAVYKNRRRLGVTKSGLCGEYCWYTSMYYCHNTVSIERGTLH